MLILQMLPTAFEHTLLGLETFKT